MCERLIRLSMQLRSLQDTAEAVEKGDVRLDEADCERLTTLLAEITEELAEHNASCAAHGFEVVHEPEDAPAAPSFSTNTPAPAWGAP